MGKRADGGQATKMIDELAAELRGHGVRGHVYIVGRRPVAFAVRRNRTTRRVENIGRDPATLEVAIAEIGKRHGAGPDWLDRLAASASADDATPAPPLFDTPDLVVTGASASHALAACLEAANEVNAQDVVHLAERLGLTDPAEAVAIHQRVYPGSRLTAAATATIECAMARLRPTGPRTAIEQ